MPCYRFLADVTYAGVSVLVDADNLAAAREKVQSGDIDDIDIGPADMSDIKVKLETGEAAN